MNFFTKLLGIETKPVQYITADELGTIGIAVKEFKEKLGTDIDVELYKFDGKFMLALHFEFEKNN